jgi:hypothetical protein
MAVTDTACAYGSAYGARLSVPAIVGGLALLAAALHLVMPFNHDEAWIIHGSGWVLDGGEIGKDLVDMNPPLVWWLYAPLVWLARHIGLRADHLATLLTVLTAALSLGVVERLLRNDDATPLQRALVPVAAALVLFYPGYDFGQREHWMVLLTLPYVVARWRRADNAKISTLAATAIGFVASLGFCIKPHYLLVPVVLEIWLLARTRRPLVWLAPETIALAVTGLACAAATLVFAPAYLEQVVPNVLLGYWVSNSPLSTIAIASAMILAPAAAFAALGYLSLRDGQRIPTLAQAFGVAGLTCLAVALVQMKPWPYHFLPAVLYCDLFAAALLLLGTARAGANNMRLGAIAVLVAMSLSNSAAFLIRNFQDNSTANRVAKLADVFRENAGPNRAVAGFITSPRDVLPAAIAAGVTWVKPLCCTILVPAAVRADEAPAAERAKIKAAALAQVEGMLSAIRDRQPGVIVIDAGDHKLAFGDRKFDYVPWLEARTNFAAILRQYREISPIGPFQVFVRK